MAKELSGIELAGYIKERQAKQVRMLRQAYGVIPRLVIIKSVMAGEVINTYVRMKMRYAADILIEVTVVECSQEEMIQAIRDANNDPLVHGIVVQLPIDRPEQTDEIVSLIDPHKDVDGLGPKAEFVSATAEAIDWLLAGYNIELSDKHIALIGHGKLVGRPLDMLWRSRGYDVTVINSDSLDQKKLLRRSNVVVAATGVPRILTTDMVSAGTIIIDAGTASESGVIVGDVDPELRNRTDIDITPEKGGVGPLTIVLMFDHVIRVALAQVAARGD
ncbi:putative Methylenetetrahydrofolate dehydrogenase (NADP(+)) [Candidatus Saccharimonas aalborgensis]|uniref:Putative Methylenetetrahydrofolate dehydrogenase (NADP(+)) n=1 Tax=Candidatus Saccharimonas aalborgensis TaxID=1332188 RepID=R4PUZ2_9BACT|nr:bifunctional 5,10-methylenetetrahydrofolate dehydrogenase/5,10-methenyltetrahydrofolate cyclohydrolase [Candidatus Saccharimonas aalborgensis]AGL61995.1 putative Methylenetetrahydrofolate dehydrogenase (NADP(+)) [Candidatus Saccharimonas aalborgensis]QQS68523.1 MAG: bifunctional 5,10-methylenetetrahydrofolate dehydrogenase/5,10-methenyltetrahydrofolate cyclohydrolase [Candidatus Saccharibacteria bacterium]